MKQRVALAIALAGLVLGVYWATAAGAGGPSLSGGGTPVHDLTIREGHQDAPLICLDGVIDVDDDMAHARGFDCESNQLLDQDDPPAIDMRPVEHETADA